MPAKQLVTINAVLIKFCIQTEVESIIFSSYNNVKLNKQTETIFTYFIEYLKLELFSLVFMRRKNGDTMEIIFLSRKFYEI